MSISKRIADKAEEEYWYSDDATGATGIDIQPDELEELIRLELLAQGAVCPEAGINDGCPKCDALSELYERTPQSKRDYWVMTELFVMLHGGDVCSYAFGEGGNG